jgi:hypothetical protein
MGQISTGVGINLILTIMFPSPGPSNCLNPELASRAMMRRFRRQWALTVINNLDCGICLRDRPSYPTFIIL